MSEIERLRALLAALTEGCAPGPWHGVESGDRGAFGWWLDNEAGDSSFPTPEDVAVIVNALPELLNVAEAARKSVEWADVGGLLLADVVAVRAALARLDSAS